MFEQVLDKAGRSTNEQERQKRIQKVTRSNDDDKNPCMKEQKMSLKCLQDHNYDRDKCSIYFKNYKNCREFWSMIMKERNRKGISPSLPPAEERETIQKDYIARKMSWVFYLIFGIINCSTNGEVQRPRGVAISKASLYQPGKSFYCFDGSGKIEFGLINDDYCDCVDGSDEPGTSACTNGQFHCTNAGYKPQYISSAWVNDGICDCCDGTDEYSGIVSCENNCMELGKELRVQQQAAKELAEQGYLLKVEYSKQGLEAKQNKKERLTELALERTAQETLRVNLEAIKKEKEYPEKEAKDKHQQAWEEEKARRAAEEEKKSALEAFIDLDTNQDNQVSIEELMDRTEFDIDSNGTVTPDEAKEHLEDNDQVDFDMFLEKIWPNIKGIYKPVEQEPTETPDEGAQEARGDEGEPNTTPPPPIDFPPPPGSLKEGDPDIADHDEYHPDFEEEYDGEDEEDDLREAYEEEEEEEPYDEEDNSDNKDKAGDNDDQMPDYDEETQQLIDAADEARKNYKEADDKISDIDREMTECNELIDLDLGSDHEFFPLKGQCYEYTDREYTYKLCPFQKSTQRPKNGGAETSLGTWGKWDGPADNKYSVMKYENGQGCWNGPNRSTTVKITCGTTSEVFSATEPSRCEYQFEFRTPAACNKQVDTGSHYDHEEL
ncbi:unnamed protein product [Owenia fusiformis]|uniref:Glucosidase 2 subunit beta n=1 Tax=Owenia fusiformis TaxID=6347 RepID=A0A8S4N1H4_OWEFU|nr:unnamed protein product [Owenia fusiformis]